MLYNQSMPNPPFAIDNTDRLAAILIFVTAFSGVLVNVVITLFLNKISTLRNSFGRLLRLQSVADGIFVSVWAFYFAPVLFFDISVLQRLEVAARFGQLCLICYDISIYTHLVIAINRFLCIYFPTKYSFIFTDRLTTILIVGIVIISFAFSWFLVAVNCVMGFSSYRWMLDYVSAPCDMTNPYYAEFVRGLIIICMFAAINALTFLRMHFRNTRSKEMNKVETAQQIKRRKGEARFVQQVCLQSVIYVAELVTYFYIATFVPMPDQNIREYRNRWPNFLLTTYMWILVHTLDGYVTVWHNNQFRSIIFNRQRTVTQLPGRSQSKQLSSAPDQGTKSAGVVHMVLEDGRSLMRPLLARDAIAV